MLHLKSVSPLLAIKVSGDLPDFAPILNLAALAAGLLFNCSIKIVMASMIPLMLLFDHLKARRLSLRSPLMVR